MKRNEKLPRSPGGKEFPAIAEVARGAGVTPQSGRSPGVGSSNSLQCSCLENSMDRGAWWAAIHGVAKSRT